MDMSQASPTWMSTSREDGISGIRLLRVPVGVNWIGSLPGIELVHAGHRYVIAAPSVHDKTGKTYRFIGPDGVNADRIPVPGELPDLPLAWVVRLCRPYPRAESADLGNAKINAWPAKL